MSRFWVFGEWWRNWERQLFYVDANQHDSYIRKQQFDIISKERLVMVQDDCFEILSELPVEELCATIDHYLDNNATLIYN